MHNPIQLLLSRLDSAKQTGPDKWAAQCPSHEDRSPSLAIKEAPGGAVLLHCFAGCSADEVCGALGLDLSDLFPKAENFDHAQPGQPQRRPWSASDVLRAVQHELLVVAILARKVLAGETTEEDQDRMSLAISRVLSASQVAA